jgi:hypothetical protein
MKKRSPPHILADEHLSEACNKAIGHQSAGGGLKPLLKTSCWVYENILDFEISSQIYQARILNEFIYFIHDFRGVC